MKRITLLLTLVSLTLAQADAYDFKVDGIYYNKNGNKATVTYKSMGKKSYSGKVIIPNMVNYGGINYDVTAIGDYALLYCDQVTEVSLPSTITSIGQSAFYGCEALTSVELPISITTMKDMAFHGCTNLTTINIPKNLTTINAATFAFCNSLKHIDIPNTVTDIKESAFLDAGLTNVIIPNSITTIAERVFSQCNELTSVTIGSQVKHIEENAFDLCFNLRKIFCLAVIPPTMAGKNCFNITKMDGYNTYDLATLYVPKQSVQAYKATQWWCDFANIKAIGSDDDPADANGDGEVNISDINKVIEFILAGNQDTAGDVNDDKEVNIADINFIIKVILQSN